MLGRNQGQKTPRMGVVQVLTTKADAPPSIMLVKTSWPEKLGHLQVVEKTGRRKGNGFEHHKPEEKTNIANDQVNPRAGGESAEQLSGEGGKDGESGVDNRHAQDIKKRKQKSSAFASVAFPPIKATVIGIMG